MLCQRCQRHLRGCEGVKCGQCESRFHLRCAGDAARDARSAGDRAYHWKCALCQNSETKVHLESVPVASKEDPLLTTINAICDKFELVNKIQLPKLSNDLLQLKSITDNIVKQNESILQKIEEFEKRNKQDKIATNNQSQNYRRRNQINLSTRSYNLVEHNDSAPMLPPPEKAARYRPRRRSYLLNKMFNLLNRKLRGTTTPRRKR